MEETSRRIRCNSCGKEIKMRNDIPMEDFLEITKQWGYFSAKDGTTHHLVICENCYTRWIRNFMIPVDETDTKELI